MIRDDIKAALVTAMKSGDKARTATLRLVQASIKNRDIELRTAASSGDDDATVSDVLQKMVKQRRESIELYEKGGRQELADAEKAEVAVIEAFLPAQMSDAGGEKEQATPVGALPPPPPRLSRRRLRLVRGGGRGP